MDSVAIKRADGVNTSERYLKRLCDRTFLSMWSYSGMYRDQGKASAAADGKEVCDLLVVFENHILIFSDKDCVFPDSGDLDRDWSRWYRRAIESSAKQVWGAERWIKEHPDRLFLDRACTQLFPISLPDPSTATFHRIVVAHGAAERCRRELGGSGSLMLFPDVSGSQHTRSRQQGGVPFAVGQVDPAKGFIHVLDDTTLDILLGTLDTISDFVSYLSRKEDAIQRGIVVGCAGEENLLAYYLRWLNDDGEHDFVVPHDADAIFADEGQWSEFSTNHQRLAQIEANRISYAWDSIIEKFAHHALAGTQYYTAGSGLQDTEKVLRFMARETRTQRRALSTGLYQLIRKTPERNIRGTRVIKPSRDGDPFYVFLLLPDPLYIVYEQYREVRRKMLEALCMTVKVRFPEAQDIVGLAMETGMRQETSEDSAYLDARNWTAAHQAEAESVARELGLLVSVKEHATRVQEYPEQMLLDVTQATGKGRDRNKPCPCGSGGKYKRCCGR